MLPNEDPTEPETQPSTASPVEIISISDDPDDDDSPDDKSITIHPWVHPDAAADEPNPAGIIPPVPRGSGDGTDSPDEESKSATASTVEEACEAIAARQAVAEAQQKLAGLSDDDRAKLAASYLIGSRGWLPSA